MFLAQPTALSELYDSLGLEIRHLLICNDVLMV